MRWCSCSTRRFRRGSRGRNTSWPTSWRNGLNAARTSWPSPSRCSDGQRFPAKGKSITARALSRYFADEGLSTYTHLTDQHAVYGTKVIVATDREAPYVLDEILGNQTDLPITEHATDTHGANAQLRPIRPVRAAAVPPHPRPGQDHPLPRSGPRRGVRPVPGSRSAADPAHQLPADRRELGRDAAAGGQLEVRARHRLADRGQAVPRRPAEHPRSRAQGIRGAPAYHLRRPVPGPAGLPSQDRPPAQQG